MVPGAGMFASWLLGQVADAGRKRLTIWVLGSDQERALRQAAAIAVQRTAAELRPGDYEQAAQIAMVVDQVFGPPLQAARPLAKHATLLDALQAGIAGQLAPLDDADLTETGRSCAELLGVPVAELAEQLTIHLLQEIVARGSAGGPLAPLASQLNHDRTHRRIDELPSRVAEALAAEGSAIPPPAQLPRTIGDFTGRVEDLLQLRALLDAPAPRTPDAIVISALDGQGGVGKTTLAVYLAHEYSEMFPDGQLYADLRGIGPPEEVLSAADVLADFLRSLGIGSANIPDSLEARAALFRSRLHGKRFLILLDNAANEDQLEPLLPASNGCSVLVTSRARLTTLAGARHLRLGVMSKPDAMALFTQLVLPHVIEDTAAAEAIVDLCGCLPLAIRIAGAQVADSGDLSGFRRDLAAETSRLAALKYGNLDLRASLGVSYHYGLSSDAQRAFRLLGIGGASTFPSWVVASLLNETRQQAGAIVRELVTAQLLENTGEEAVGCPRYRFHDLVRDLAREFLSDAEKAEGTQRLVNDYAALARHAQALLEPPGPGDDDGDAVLHDYLGDVVAAMNSDWLAWFSDDRHNLLDVIRAASQQELWADTSRLCELATTLVEVPSYWDDWSQISDIGLRANRSGSLPAAEARTLRHLGDLRVYQGKRDDAKVCLQESVDIFREQGDEAGEAASLIRLGEVQRLTGDSADALASMVRGHAIYERLGNELGVAYALTSLGGVLRVRARWKESIEAFLQCIPMLKAAGRRRQAAIALVSLGDVYHLKSMWAEAYQCFDECLALFTSLGDQMWA